MATSGYLLSEEKLKKLNEHLDPSHAQRAKKPQKNPVQQPLNNSAEVLVVQTPDDEAETNGIDALVKKTGDEDYDHPGFAECDICQITPSVTTGKDFDVVPILEGKRIVFNLSETPIEKSKQLLAVKDKFGNWIAAQSGSSLTPGFLYDDAVPDATGINMHPAKIESGSWVADTDADKILVDNTHPGTFRGYGSNHSGFSATTAAKVWVTPGPGGNPVIVCGKGLAKRCKCQLTATLTATTASCTVDNVTATDSGQSPTASSSTTMTVYIQLNPSSSGGYAGADNTVCYIEWHEDDDKWYIYDMPCSA